MNKLDQLKQITTVVADTGDLNMIAQYRPQDATTNPSLLLKAAQDTQYRSLLDQAISLSLRTSSSAASNTERVRLAADQFAVLIGAQIAGIVPGLVSTEVDARLSFSTPDMVTKALQLIDLYALAGIDTNRILIKIAATWEGIQAAKILEARCIKCNLTLLFGFAQAQACADAGVFLISPFVGRIFDWYQEHTNLVVTSPDQDPGVQSVSRIYHYYKAHGYDTVVMGASFRNQGQIEALAGCDRLTISPSLLADLQTDNGTLVTRLSAANTSTDDIKRVPHESSFRFDLNADAMASDKLADGIRRFVADQNTLEDLLESC